jgi:HAD superfamily hydrolase (TIGR01509 family)
MILVMTQPTDLITNNLKTPIFQSLDGLQAVLWDMDGTLVNSEPLHDAAIYHVGAQDGHVITEDTLNESLGGGHKHCYDLLEKKGLVSQPYTQWMAQIEAHYLTLAPNVSPRGNTVDIVRALHAHGIKQAVFSNSPRAIVQANVTAFLRFFDNPQDIFGAVLSIHDVQKIKPDPQGYLLAAEQLGVPITACAVIEDSPTGVTAGKASGAFTIFWPETSSVVAHLHTQPDLIVHDPHYLHFI